MTRTMRAGTRGFRRMRGVTLMELMIVVAIVGILAAIAYPSYKRQMEHTRRSDGKSVLLDTAQRLERCFTRYNAYNTGGCATATTIAGAGQTSPGGWYVVTAAGGALTATAFTLTATPQNAQTGDTFCANLTLTQSGVRGASGTVPTTCW